MKCVITYFQNKRISLPYIFNKYTLPMMKETFPGEVKLYHIHHDTHIEDNRLASNRELDHDNLLHVRKYIKSFSNVISHQEIFKDFLLLPSCRIGINICLQENADLHLWLEDDAIVHDTSCHTWIEQMKDKDVGTFRQTAQNGMFNCAFMLSTKSYDKRLLLSLENYKDDGIYYPESSQFENLLYKNANASCLLNRNAAFRHHPRGKYKITGKEVADWLKNTIPDITEDDINLLKYDFLD